MKALYWLIYFVLVTPIGRALQLFGYDPLQLSGTKERQTAFIDRNHTFSGADLETS